MHACASIRTSMIVYIHMNLCLCLCAKDCIYACVFVCSCVCVCVCVCDEGEMKWNWEKAVNPNAIIGRKGLTKIREEILPQGV